MRRPKILALSLKHLRGTLGRPKKKSEREHQEQCALIEWFDHAAPTRYKFRLFAIPNGGDRHPGVGKKLKLEGMRPGVLDLQLPVARQGFIGLWVEMKFGTNTLTDNQAGWKEFLEDNGHRVEVCYSFSAARAVIVDYLGMDA